MVALIPNSDWYSYSDKFSVFFVCKVLWNVEVLAKIITPVILTLFFRETFQRGCGSCNSSPGLTLPKQSARKEIKKGLAFLPFLFLLLVAWIRFDFIDSAETLKVPFQKSWLPWGLSPRQALASLEGVPYECSWSHRRSQDLPIWMIYETIIMWSEAWAKMLRSPTM